MQQLWLQVVKIGYKTNIIAEVKTRSSDGSKSDLSWRELFELAHEIGDIIAIHTDFDCGGSFELLKRAKLLTHKPILAMGLHEHDWMVEHAIDYGANYVLAVGRIPPTCKQTCIIEPVSIEQLKLISEDRMVMWNTGNLESPEESFLEARALFNGWMCQAGNIRSIDDVHSSADAVLVGEHLTEFAESLRKEV